MSIRIRTVCVGLILVLLIAPAANAGGLRTHLGEVVVENLQIGQTYNLKDLANLSLMVVNTSEYRVKLQMDVLSPDEVESLEAGMAQEVDVIIEPPSKTIAGDYMITMIAISKDLPRREINLRVTVLTPTIWGWVAVLIVLAVIAGLGIIFRRLGRR